MLISEFTPSKCNFVIVNKDGDYIDLGKPIDVTLDCAFLAFNRKINATLAIPAVCGKTGAVDRLIKKHLLDNRHLYSMGAVPRVEKVILHDPAVVVYWKDGTKTVAKAQNERYDPEKGLAMCFVKKMLDMSGKTLTVFNKLLKGADAK